MRRTVCLLAILLPSLIASAHEHGDDLRPLTRQELLARFQEWTGRPMREATVPDAVPVTNSTKAFTITAKSFSFNVSPSPFVVNQGDTVSVTITVPSGDPSPVGHGVLMEQYITNGVTVQAGHSQTTTFIASTPGTFEFICTQPSCGGGHNSMVGMLVVNAGAPAPMISGVAPSVIPTTGNVMVTVSGSNFASGATATVDGAPVSLSVTSSSQAQFTAPAHPAGQAMLTIVNPDGQSISTTLNYVQAGPSITSVNPQSLPNSGGAITINGAGFQQGATVKIGAQLLSRVQVQNASTLVVNVPVAAAGEPIGVPETVIVTNPDGTAATLVAAFTYTLAPLTINSIAPARALAGKSVTITGTGFSSTVPVSVLFGTIPATNVAVINADTITATVPQGTGTVNLTVTVSSATKIVTNGFTYGAAGPHHRAAGH